MSTESQTYLEFDFFTAPTIYRDVKMEDPIMSSEIFGPVLPIITVSGPDEAIGIVNSQEKPLALYIFAKANSVSKHLFPSLVTDTRLTG